MKSYGQFCPVAKAAEILAERWTLLVVRELLAGSRRFNELRRGVPLMSPTLLSKRLAELERAGIVVRVPLDGARGSEYRLTAAGEELRPVVGVLGAWGERWVVHDIGPDDLDPSLLMWDMRRRVVLDALPAPDAVVRFGFHGVASGRRWWWLVADAGEVDLCLTDPGRDVDLTVWADLRSLVLVWIGRRALGDALADGTMVLDGDAELAAGFADWIGLSGLDAERSAALSRLVGA